MAELLDLGFYYDPGRIRIDWDSLPSAAIVNPEWLKRDPAGIARNAAALPALERHVWVATSGSSSTVPGHIRWVALSASAFLASAEAVNRHLESAPGDVWAHALPVFHVGGLGILARAHLSGARVVAAVTDRWDAWRFQQRLHEVHATLTALVPAQLHDLVGARLPAPASLRAAIVGGARLDPELCADARGLGWRCLPSYGLTETCSQVATASLATALGRRCSGPLPVLSHAEIRSDADHRLSIRAASLATCYAEMTEEGLRSWDPKEDGWLQTEDLGRVTAEGVEVLGRATDSVKVLGEMVSLPRVEEAVRHWLGSQTIVDASGLDVSLVALADDRRGHELVVVLAGEGRRQVEPRTGTELFPSLDAFSRAALLPYERPSRIAWVDVIPRTALGKVQRPLLTEQVRLQAGAQR